MGAGLSVRRGRRLPLRPRVLGAGSPVPDGPVGNRSGTRPARAAGRAPSRRFCPNKLGKQTHSHSGGHHDEQDVETRTPDPALSFATGFPCGSGVAGGAPGVRPPGRRRFRLSESLTCPPDVNSRKGHEQHPGGHGGAAVVDRKRGRKCGRKYEQDAANPQTAARKTTTRWWAIPPTLYTGGRHGTFTTDRLGRTG